jgi:hypothetical protein
MTKRLFFSFDHEKDKWRAEQVRDAWLKNPDMQAYGFTDEVSWEDLKWEDRKATMKWIDREMQGSPVTVVLIGSETSRNELVDYAIRQSRQLKKVLFGIYIHNLKDKDGNTEEKGKNPFENYCIEKKGEMIDLTRVYPSYDWVDDDGPKNLANWVLAAADRHSRRV